MKTKKITAWKRFDKEKQRWFHNHIEDGWVHGEKPVGHPDWKNGTWIKKHCYMINDKVVDNKEE